MKYSFLTFNFCSLCCNTKNLNSNRPASASLKFYEQYSLYLILCNWNFLPNLQNLSQLLQGFHKMKSKTVMFRVFDCKLV